jgi:hypothetical protein
MDIVANTSDANDKKAPSRADFATGIPTASTFIKNTQYTGSSEGGGPPETRAVSELEGLETGRMSWQQLNRE